MPICWPVFEICGFFTFIVTYFRPCWGGGLMNLIPKCSQILSGPQKAHSWPETRVLAYRSSRSVKECDLGACQKSNKKKRNFEIWQVTYLPRASTLQYPTKVARGGARHSQPCQVSSQSAQAFRLYERSKSAFYLCLALWHIRLGMRASRVQHLIIGTVIKAYVLIIINSWWGVGRPQVAMRRNCGLFWLIFMLLSSHKTPMQLSIVIHHEWGNVTAAALHTRLQTH